MCIRRGKVSIRIVLKFYVAHYERPVKGWWKVKKTNTLSSRASGRLSSTQGIRLAQVFALFQVETPRHALLHPDRAC